jgi:hypothetical protein
LLERELIILLLPRGLITAVLAIQVIDDRGAEFGFLRVVALATMLLTNLLVMLAAFGLGARDRDLRLCN